MFLMKIWVYWGLIHRPEAARISSPGEYYEGMMCVVMSVVMSLVMSVVICVVICVVMCIHMCSHV